MDRKRRIRCHILTLCMYVLLQACQADETSSGKVNFLVTFDSGGYSTKSMDPDEVLISDISLMIFDERGDAEECIWLPDAREPVSLELIKGKSYSFRACANFGYPVYADHIDELQEVKYHMAYPDEYREGIPMYAETDGVRPSDKGIITLSLSRLMAKVSLRIDRRRLSDDVEMYVRSVRIGNCPKSVSVFRQNSIDSPDQCFSVGFSRDDHQTGGLNMTTQDGKSKAISLYMLENIQGAMPDGMQFAENDPRRDVCSYIEMEIDYLSDSHASKNPLIYRFYLGDGGEDLEVERNCHYRITVCPEGDGLSKDGWMVDKSGITDIEPVSFSPYPSSYINADIGDKIHIGCKFTPVDTPFDVGIIYMEEDHLNGIYDYVIDEDGHGAVLTLTGPGTGLIYMEAGEPINDAALFIIEVNQP